MYNYVPIFSNIYETTKTPKTHIKPNVPTLETAIRKFLRFLINYIQIIVI